MIEYSLTPFGPSRKTNRLMATVSLSSLALGLLLSSAGRD